MKAFLVISLMFLAPSIYANGGINSIYDIETCYIFDQENLLSEEQKIQLENAGYIFTDETVEDKKVDGNRYLPYYIPFIAPLNNAFGLEFQNETRSGVHIYHVYNIYPKEAKEEVLVSEGVKELLSFGVCKVN